MQIDLETAYQEACLALGQSLVRERLLNAHIARLEEQLRPATPARENDHDQP